MLDENVSSWDRTVSGSLSRYHLSIRLYSAPWATVYAGYYLPAESNTGRLFGGNSKLARPGVDADKCTDRPGAAESYTFGGDEFVQRFTGRGMTLFEVGQEIVRRLTSTFCVAPMATALSAVGTASSRRSALWRSDP